MAALYNCPVSPILRLVYSLKLPRTSLQGFTELQHHDGYKAKCRGDRCHWLSGKATHTHVPLGDADS